MAAHDVGRRHGLLLLNTCGRCLGELAAVRRDVTEILKRLDAGQGSAPADLDATGEKERPLDAEDLLRSLCDVKDERLLSSVVGLWTAGSLATDLPTLLSRYLGEESSDRDATVVQFQAALSAELQRGTIRGVILGGGCKAVLEPPSLLSVVSRELESCALSEDVERSCVVLFPTFKGASWPVINMLLTRCAASNIKPDFDLLYGAVVALLSPGQSVSFQEEDLYAMLSAAQGRGQLKLGLAEGGAISVETPVAGKYLVSLDSEQHESRSAASQHNEEMISARQIAEEHYDALNEAFSCRMPAVVGVPGTSYSQVLLALCGTMCVPSAVRSLGLPASLLTHPSGGSLFTAFQHSPTEKGRSSSSGEASQCTEEQRNRHLSQDAHPSQVTHQSVSSHAAELVPSSTVSSVGGATFTEPHENASRNFMSTLSFESPISRDARTRESDFTGDMADTQPPGPRWVRDTGEQGLGNESDTAIKPTRAAAGSEIPTTADAESVGGYDATANPPSSSGLSSGVVLATTKNTAEAPATKAQRGSLHCVHREVKKDVQAVFVSCFKDDLCRDRQLLMSQINNLCKMRNEGKCLQYKHAGYEKLHDFMLDIPGLALQGAGNRMEVRLHCAEEFHAFCEDVTQGRELAEFRRPQPVSEAFKWRVIEVFRRMETREIPAKSFRDMWNCIFPDNKLQCRDFGYRDVKGLLANVPIVEKVGGKYNTKYVLKKEIDFMNLPNNPSDVTSAAPESVGPYFGSWLETGRTPQTTAIATPQQFRSPSPPQTALTQKPVPLQEAMQMHGLSSQSQQPPMHGAHPLVQAMQVRHVYPQSANDDSTNNATTPPPSAHFSSSKASMVPAHVDIDVGGQQGGNRQRPSFAWDMDDNDTSGLIKFLELGLVNENDRSATSHRSPSGSEATHGNWDVHVPDQTRHEPVGSPPASRFGSRNQRLLGQGSQPSSEQDFQPEYNLGIDNVNPLCGQKSCSRSAFGSGKRSAGYPLHPVPGATAFSSNTASVGRQQGSTNPSQAVARHGVSSAEPQMMTEAMEVAALASFRTFASCGNPLSLAVQAPPEATRKTQVTNGVTAMPPREEQEDQLKSSTGKLGRATPADPVKGRREMKFALPFVSFMSSPGAISTKERDALRTPDKYDMITLCQEQLRRDRNCLIVDFSNGRVLLSNALCDNLFKTMTPLPQRDVAELIHEEHRPNFSTFIMYLNMGNFTVMEPQEVRMHSGTGVSNLLVTGELLVGTVWWLGFALTRDGEESHCSEQAESNMGVGDVTEGTTSGQHLMPGSSRHKFSV